MLKTKILDLATANKRNYKKGWCKIKVSRKQRVISTSKKALTIKHPCGDRWLVSLLSPLSTPLSHNPGQNIDHSDSSRLFTRLSRNWGTLGYRGGFIERLRSFGNLPSYTAPPFISGNFGSKRNEGG
ncbi:hypothetical protein J6590_008127 [Homalodisca vitripennis]|nr:hypothetical protein J6590_008127 [Homalodisca vitripennis]